MLCRFLIRLNYSFNHCAVRENGKKGGKCLTDIYTVKMSIKGISSIAYSIPCVCLILVEIMCTNFARRAL